MSVCVSLSSVALKGVFDQRMKTWSKWQDAQVMLQRKREAEAKLQYANKPDKLQQAKDEIKEVKYTQTHTHTHYFNPQPQVHSNPELHLRRFL